MGTPDFRPCFLVGVVCLGCLHWWFVDRTLSDFVIAIVLWTATFAFTFVGVPLVRMVVRRRR